MPQVKLNIHNPVPNQAQIRYDTGFSPHDSLEFLVSSEAIWCRWWGDSPRTRTSNRGTPPSL